MYNQGKIIKRLLGRTDNDISNDPGIGATGPSNPQAYRPNASQNAVYSSSVPIAYVDRSPDGRVAVLGGRHILKTIHIDGLKIKEGVDVRAAITAQLASKGSAATLASDQLSIKDVKIATQHGAEPTIFTACANGKIFMYDINRLASGLGLEFIQSSEGSRQVNKLDFNPHRGTWMLSGGQDGIVRCFDVKAPVALRTGLAYRTLQAFRCNADPIRDVKWAPKDGMIFACATESGAIMKWDIRKPSAPLLKINAHDPQKGVSSLSWHPDGDHLMSSGLDGKCYVWDLSPEAEKRQKPKWTINAPAPVTNVSWRPGLWSATAQGRRAAQVAVAYDEGGNLKKKGIRSVHIWDLARPTMPYKEIELFESSPSALLWHDRDLLWAVGQEGFAQCDIAFAPKVMDRQPLSNLDFSARGEVLMFLQERVQTTRPRANVKTPSLLPSSYNLGQTGQMLSISRSDSEEDVIGSFLGPKRRIGNKRRSGHRPAHSLSSTPPSGLGTDSQVISLDQAIKLTVPFKPQQVMAIGSIPAAVKVDSYQFLSRKYLEILAKDLPSSSGAGTLDQRILGIMNKYAQAAESAGQFRLAQTWRILSYAINLLLASRSKYHIECRLAKAQANESNSVKSDETKASLFHIDSASHRSHSYEEAPSLASSIASTDSRRIRGRLRLIQETGSESNVPTPLARPVQDGRNGFKAPAIARTLTPIQDIEVFSLPPATYSSRSRPRQRPRSTSLSAASQLSSTEGYDFYDIEAVESLPAAIDVPKRKDSLRVDPMEPKSLKRSQKSTVRLESDESSTQMISLSDARRQASFSGWSAQQAAARRQIHELNDDDNETEFASRIRGQQLDEVPVNRGWAVPQPVKSQISDGLMDDLMVSQTITDTTDTFESEANNSGFSQSREIINSPAVHEASRFIWGPPRPQDHISPTITETDFLPWDDDPPYPYPISSDGGVHSALSSIKPYEILAQAFAFESRRSSLNAFAMILLLKPLVPDNVIDSHHATAVLRQHHSRLMGMKLFVEAALLRNLCLRGWPDGFDDWGENYASIFRAAQDKVAIGYSCAQCHKPRVIKRSSTEGSDIWQCERCRAHVAPCAVCGHREAASEFTSFTVDEGLSTSNQSEKSILSTWWYCSGCSHGGHANCLQDWHASIAGGRVNCLPENIRKELFEDDSPQTNSDGCCPFDGCGHACLPGRWRNESSTARTEELGRAVREQYRGVITDLKESQPKLPRDQSVVSTPPSSVREDILEVPQSRAVESAREVLASNALAPPEKAGGLVSILSSSPGRTGSYATGSGGVERERRKSVKFAGASDDWR